MSERDDFQLDRFWDALATGQPAGATPGGAELLPELYTLHSAIPPGSARERARHRVFDSIASTQENTMTALTLPASMPATNGHAPKQRPLRSPDIPSTTLSRRQLWLSVAAVLALLIAGTSGFFAYERLSGPDHPAVIPAAQDATPTPDAQDWPMYRGNPGRTGAMPGSGPKITPGVVWSALLDGSANRSPIVVGDTAYVGTAQGTLYALDAATGAQRWTFTGDASLEITPAYMDGVVFIPSLTGTLYAVDAASGTQLWQFAEPTAEFATPTFGDGLLFVGSETNNRLYGIDPKAGTETWHFDTGGAITRGQAYADGVLYSGSVGGILYALDAATGTQKWQYDAQQDSIGTPAVADGVVYTTSPTGQLILVDAAAGEEIKRIDSTSTDGISPPTIGNGLLYVGTWAGSIDAVDPSTEEVIWSYPTKQMIRAALALVDGVIYGVSIENEIYALDAATGAELWTFEADGAMDFGPTVAQGLLLFSTDAGSVEALGEGVAAVATPTVVTEVAASPVASGAFDPAQVSFVWEATKAGTTPLGQPIPALGPDGNIHVVDGELRQILVFSPDGELLDQWGDPGSGPGQIGYSQSLGFDAEGNSYVFDAGNTRVMKFAPDHSLLAEWGSVGTANGQFGLQVEGTVDPVNGLVYVADFDNNRIQVFDLDGNFLDKWGNLGKGEGELYHPVTIVVGPDGLIYVGEAANGSGSHVQIFNSAGTYKGTLFDADGRQARFTEAWGIAFDSAGNIYVSDYWDHSIQVFGKDRTKIGTIENVPGAGPFMYTERIVIDAEDNLYVADWKHGRLVKLALTPIE